MDQPTASWNHLVPARPEPVLTSSHLGLEQEQGALWELWFFSLHGATPLGRGREAFREL